MLSYEESVTIDRPIGDVFRYMQDIDREHEWQPNLREAEQIPPGEPGVGTRRRYVSEFMGRRFENVYVNEVYEPERRVVYQTAPESDTQASGEIIWESVAGGTKVTMRFSARIAGVLRFVPDALVTSVGKRELADTLARLKERLETSGS